MPTLRFILGDQLNSQHSWFQTNSSDTLYVLMELRQEATYARHHIQKVVGFFIAMRAFADDLRQAGHRVAYLTLDDPANAPSLEANLLRFIQEHRAEKFEYQLPDEYRLDVQLKKFCETLSIPSQVFDTEHFISERHELGAMFHGKKTFLMEAFYQRMRKKHGILMDGDKPVSGRWNFDAENRKKLPKGHLPVQPLMFKHDVCHITQLLENQQIETIGTIDPAEFIWPINRAEALKLLDFFTKECLLLFGTFEDAMTHTHWVVYHSRLSFAMNTKMLSPLEVITEAIKAWENRPEEISLSQIEGFVRQIIGWREYMRGIYWAKMPAFAEMNYFHHTRKLPAFYWTAQTKMHCLRAGIGQSLTHGYAHHIQRLMIMGAFALLAGVHPDETDAWYLGIYIDAIEWVEITNTRGMSQFADGGIVGTKPYVCSANYIDKMSDYCSTCYYDKTKKTGHKACPFNSLYWHFYDRHRGLLANNPRIGMAYVTWNKQPETLRKEIIEQAEFYLKNIDTL